MSDEVPSLGELELHVLRLVEMWNYETALHRPRLGKLTKLMLVARAWLMARRTSKKGGHAK